MFYQRFQRQAVVLSGVLLVLGMLMGCMAAAEDEPPARKILWVDSYHSGYPWSDGIEEGVRSQLEGADVTLNVFRLDTKRNTDVAFGQAVAQTALAEIERLTPDIIIATDDNAQKYLVVPI